MSDLYAVTETDRTVIATPPTDTAPRVLAIYERERKAGRFAPDVIRFELSGGPEPPTDPQTFRQEALQL